jgi:hypothetical protein
VVLGGALLALALAQLLLPAIAADRIASRLRRHGSVQSVQVRAWPAVELLWGSADSVDVRAGSLAMSAAQAAGFLWEAHGAHRVGLYATSVRVGRLRLSDVRFSKLGRVLRAEALTSDADVRAALPPGVALALLGSSGGRVRVRASGGLFGVGVSVEAVAGAIDGRLIAHPLGPLREGFQLTLFSDPHVHVDGVGAGVVPGRPGTYRLTLAASLR